MKPEDTVMSDAIIKTIISPKLVITASDRRLAEAQAKISFKAGKQEGIREVVEWWTEPKPQNPVGFVDEH